MNEDKKDINQISALHTLEGDLLASMKDENYGSNIVKIVTQGKGAMPIPGSTEESKPLNPNVKKYILIVVAVIFGAASILFYTKFLQEKDEDAANTTDVIVPNISSATTTKVKSINIFEADVVIPIEISNGNKFELIQKIAEAKDELLKNKIADQLNIGLLLDANLEDVFNKLQYSGPDSLLRSISKDQAYNFGVYHITGTKFETYFLMKIDIFDLGFSGMLDWEKNLPIDLERIFTYQTNTGSSTASTSVKAAENTPKFSDKVIKNIDTRTYTDSEKGTQITYGFINRQYLLITSGENSFADIVNKLLVNNILR